jgi:hypothetical protein
MQYFLLHLSQIQNFPSLAEFKFVIYHLLSQSRCVVAHSIWFMEMGFFGWGLHCISLGNKMMIYRITPIYHAHGCLFDSRENIKVSSQTDKTL